MSKESMSIRQSSGAKIVDMIGDLGSYETAELRKTLEELVAQGTLKILVNLSQVEHITSTAIGALVGTSRKLRQQGGDLFIFGLGGEIKRTFDLVGASGVLEIYDSESRALNGL